MQLPAPLQAAIERMCGEVPFQELKQAQDRITAHYAQKFGKGNSASLFRSRAAQLAYLSVRMPATYAALCSVFKRLAPTLPEPPASLLDVGAGPGTAVWAAADEFPSLQTVYCVEQHAGIAALGQQLLDDVKPFFMERVQWLRQDFKEPLPSASLAVLSYFAAEVPADDVLNLFERLWDQGVHAIVVVEPGTPDGFRRILACRQWALARKAHLLAPCPHAQACPMRGSDWCHFPARVERTRLHKRMKEASLGYEDEKYSYLAFSRSKGMIPEGRVVGPPQKNSGFVRFPLCTQGIIREETVTRSQDRYRQARDLAWGDAW